MNEEQLEIAQENARHNFERVTNRLPTRLAQKEETLLEKFSKHRGNSFTKLQALYEFMDELYSFINQFTPCQKGCNYCCHYKVSVSELEVLYIENTTKVRRLKNTLPTSNFHGTPCPFLIGGTCSIYKSRPFVCRRLVSLCQTSTWCHPDRSNTANFPLLNFSEVDKSFDRILQESGLVRMIDIRQIFGRVSQ
jgi:Fe-S-cluster containining protein